MTNESVALMTNESVMKARGRGTACVNYWCTLPDTKKGAMKKAMLKIKEKAH
jgi:hypothetical protein